MDSSQPDPRYVTIYYDRNQDGIVDVEYHRLPGGADTNWALVDTKFHGHFDLKIELGVARKETRVSFSVPRNVPIRPGKPPLWIPSDHPTLKRGD